MFLRQGWCLLVSVHTKYLSSVQSLSHVRLLATPWIAALQASLSITNSRSSLRLTSIELVMPSSHLILCHPLLLLPSFPPSIRVFSNESTLPMRWPKYWSFSFSISPSNEHPGRISFRMDWLDLLAIQGTLKSLLQHHSSKASILRCSAFFVNFQMFKLVLEKVEEPEIKLPTSTGSWKSKRVPEKHWFLLYWLCQSLWLCGSPQTGKFLKW